MEKITEDWKIGDLLDKYPETASVLYEYGFPCVGCHMAQLETLKQGALATHGKDEKFLHKLLEELNKVAIDSQKKD